MRKPLTFASIIFSAFLVAACESDGPMEDAGEAIDDAADSISDAGNDLGNAVEDACEDAKDSVNAEDSDC